MSAPPAANVPPELRPPPRRRLLAGAKRVALSVAAFYVLVCVLVCIFQTSLIYGPDRIVDFTPKDVHLAFDDLRLSTGDGKRIAAWYVPCEGARGSVIVFHGNGGNLGDRVHQIRQFHLFGYNVLAIDYHGYGQSEGSPSEQATYLDAEAAWAHLVDLRHEDPRRIVIYGESLGGGVAVELARRHTPGLLMLDYTFTRLADAGQHLVWMLPVRLLLRHPYASIDKIGAIDCPKLFVHGRSDEVVPFVLGRRLFEAAAGPKRFIETPGGHNDGGFMYNDKVTAEARSAMEELMAPVPKPTP